MLDNNYLKEEKESATDRSNKDSLLCRNLEFKLVQAQKEVQ